MEKKSVVIIGAGPAGLAAGVEILRRSDRFSVTIFETSRRIGGISATVQYRGNRMDMGGHRFFSRNARVLSWWESIMKMPLRHRISRIFYEGRFYDYPLSLSAGTVRNFGFARTLRAAASFAASRLRGGTPKNLDDFYGAHFGRYLSDTFFKEYTNKVWGRYPEQISASWGAQRVKGLSVTSALADALGISKHKETSLITEFMYPDLGPGEMWERAAAEFKKLGGRLLTGSRVTGINSTSTAISSVIYDKDGSISELNTDYLISSAPLRDLLASWRGERPESSAMAAAEGLPYRSMSIVGLLLRRMAVNAPDNWIYIQDPHVRLGRVQIFNNWSRGLVRDPENSVWLGLEYFCDEGDDFWNMGEKQCAESAAAELEKTGLAKRGDVLDFHRELVHKAYPAYFDSYSELPVIRKFLDNHENLFCVGRNGQHRYNNMDHSVLTGLEAADCIISGSSDRKNVWGVNTDGSYNEG